MRAPVSAQAPGGRTLTQHQSLALLARNHVGRIAFSFHDPVDIQPINYAYDAGWTYAPTSEGTTLTPLAHNQWVTFRSVLFRVAIGEITGRSWREVEGR